MHFWTLRNTIVTQKQGNMVCRFREIHMTVFQKYIPGLHLIQSGASSRAKHGGAYFSAVRGSIKDPIAVPGRHEVTGV